MTDRANGAPAGVVIVGAGHAGSSVAGFLRQFGYGGRIVLLGQESLPPYHRPPLSKGWLTRKTAMAAMFLRPADFYEKGRIELRLQARVTGIDPTTRTVSIRGIGTLAYDTLVLATGAEPRPLRIKGAGLQGVHSIGDIGDADMLKYDLTPGRRMVVVGGGYIGLEVAASARALGLDVTIVERETCILARTASPGLSRILQARHETEGVSFVLGSVVTEISGANRKVEGVVLADGRALPADVVLAGIGAVANDALARDAGLRCEGGVLVDQAGRTIDPHIFAIGDVSCQVMADSGRPFRLESVMGAIDQAKRAAAAIAGADLPAPDVPTFWSDQYDLRIQIAGRAAVVDETVPRGNPEGGKGLLFHLSDHRLVAVEALNAPVEFMAAKALIARGATVVAARLADEAAGVKDAVA